MGTLFFNMFQSFSIPQGFQSFDNHSIITSWSSNSQPVGQTPLDVERPPKIKQPQGLPKTSGKDRYLHYDP